MSHPLTRRIARTALLLAAGAAPVVGAAGAASAADATSLPQLGSLTAADGATDLVGEATGAASHTGLATDGLAAQVPTEGVPAAPAGLVPAAPSLGGLPLGGLGG
ncbi:ATP-binding protein [Streptomyces sp. NPDC089919]|uniref:ATP-binding protein n=1 Tax=Streptomyces sp. NPDC089919 TaxID=3155188 RepID=UPI00341C4934